MDKALVRIVEDLRAENAALRSKLEALHKAVAKVDPVYNGECALCSVIDLDRFEDGPEKHAADCPWRMARAEAASPPVKEADRE